MDWMNINITIMVTALLRKDRMRFEFCPQIATIIIAIIVTITTSIVL